MKSKFLSSIRSRILIYTIATIILFGIVLGSIVFYALFSNAQQNLISESQTSLLYMASSINNNIASVRSSILSDRISKDITNYAKNNGADDSIGRKNAHEYLQNIYTSNSDYRNTVIRILIIGNERNDIVQFVESPFSSSLINKDAILNLPYFDQAVIDADNPTCGIIEDPFLNTSVEMIPFVYTIYHPYKSDKTGYIYAEMSINALTIPISNDITSDESNYYVRMGSKIYLYKNNRFEEVTDSHLVNAVLNKNDFTITHDKDSYNNKLITVSYPLGINDWYIIKSTNMSAIWNNIYVILSVMLLIVIVFLILVGFILHRLLSNMVNIPVQKLTDRIERIEGGDFSRDTETEWNNELGDIGRTINDLSENVYSLMNQRIEDEKQKKDYEYQILQSQINPHFLYNTLNSIKWMATIQNATGIAEMTTALSRLLKDISKGANRIISLEHELSLVDDYFTIQSYRYGGTISLEKNIESDDILNCSILRFTLQPLIENAIFHGIEPKGTSGTITINVYRDDDIYIEVRDDGVGMDLDTANALLNNTQSSKSSLFKEIGIGNVNKRLKYEFGEQYGLSIDSSINEYTNITIRIPYSVQEVNDENINS